MNFDWKQFYLSPQGRVNRSQFWLRLVLPAVVISIVLTLIDLAIGTYDKQDGVGLLSGIFSLIVIIPAIFVYIKRWHDRDKSGWWMLILLDPHRRRDLVPRRMRVPRRHAGAEPVRSAAIRLRRHRRVGNDISVAHAGGRWARSALPTLRNEAPMP